VELGAGGAITVQADAISIDLVIDVNGYYSSGTSTPNYFFRATRSNPSSTPQTRTPSSESTTRPPARITAFSGVRAVRRRTARASTATTGARGRRCGPSRSVRRKPRRRTTRPSTPPCWARGDRGRPRFPFLHAVKRRARRGRVGRQRVSLPTCRPARRVLRSTLSPRRPP
jgi:hypothetical protein